MRIKDTAKLHLISNTERSQDSFLLTANAMASQIEERKDIAITVRHSNAPPCKTWTPKAVNTIRVDTAITIAR